MVKKIKTTQLKLKGRIKINSMALELGLMLFSKVLIKIKNQ